MQPFDQIFLDGGVHKALLSKDLADCVVLTLRVSKQNNILKKFAKIEKSASKALQIWTVGKKDFCKADYQMALVKYNMALMMAPVNSEAMRLSYYSRAELLMKINEFAACVKDIETCLGLNCPDNDCWVSKLQEMKAKAWPFMCIEQLSRNETSSQFAEQFFMLKGDRNPHIPFATSDVEIITESGKPKVVAAKDIPVGTVLAVETSFIRNNHNNEISCYYCLKMNFNLIPCEGCCVVMFCDKQCEQKAMQEGHNVECKITDFLLDDFKLPVKATLKIRQLCSSWDEFITASYDLGVDRMKNNTFAEMFGSEKFSLLNSHHDTHFIYGALFNRCLYFANVIHYLDTHTSFFPSSPEDKSAALRAVSRVMMHLSLYCTPVQLQHVTSVRTEGPTRFHKHADQGYFPFLGNLAHSCLPNSYVVGLGNNAALVTIAPVKKGAVLTFSYSGHWLEYVPTKRCTHAMKLYNQYRMVCKDCIVCGEFADNIFNSDSLNDAQKKAFKKFSTYYSNEMQRNFPGNIKSHYKESCNILQVLSDAPCSMEYVKAHVSFIKCLMHFVQLKFPDQF